MRDNLKYHTHQESMKNNLPVEIVSRANVGNTSKSMTTNFSVHRLLLYIAVAKNSSHCT